MDNCKICDKRLITRNACADAINNICGNCITTRDHENLANIATNEVIIRTSINNITANNDIPNANNIALVDSYSSSDTDTIMNSVRSEIPLQFNNIYSTGHFKDSNLNNTVKVNDSVIVYDNNLQNFETIDTQSNRIAEEDDPFKIDIEEQFLSVTEEAINNIKNLKNIKATENYKDALLASLYSQVNFLRQEIEEKNLMIRTLMIRDHEVYNYVPSGSSYTTTDNESEFSISSDMSYRMFMPENKTISPTHNRMSTEEQLVNYRNYHNDIYYQRNVPLSEESDGIINKKDVCVSPSTSNISDDVNDSNGGINLFIDRGINHLLHIPADLPPINNGNVVIPTTEAHPWRPGTVLITGDSMLYGIDETKLRNTKVRMHPGASIEDMYHHLGAHIRKKPSMILLLVGTNNCMMDNHFEIIDKLLALREFIKSCIPNCDVYFSTLIKRYDDKVAEKTVNLVNAELKKSETNYMDNDNIDRGFIGKKGLHMTPRGIGKLVLNIVRWLRNL